MVGWEGNPISAKAYPGDRVSFNHPPRCLPYLHATCIQTLIIVILAEFAGHSFQTMHEWIAAHPNDADSHCGQQAHYERSTQHKRVIQALQQTMSPTGFSASCARSSRRAKQQSKKKELAKHGKDAATRTRQHKCAPQQ